MKAKTIIAGVAALAMVGACGVVLAGCGSETESTTKTYTLTIDGKDYADWKVDNQQPLDMGSGHRLWGIDTWAVGTKLLQDEDGNPVGAVYSYTLTIDENCKAIGFLDYTLTFSASVPASTTYKEPSTLVYSYQGYAYEIDGGYHLMVPNYAEGSLSAECLSETFGQFGGDEADAIDYVLIEGPNGGEIYYCYTNSIIQAMGAKYHLPFLEPLLQGMSSCNVTVNGSDIVKFENKNEYAAEITLPTPEVIVTPGTDDDKKEEEDWTTLETIEDDTVAYDFSPNWSTNAEMGIPMDPSAATVTVVAGAFNNFIQMGEPMGWNNVQVTFEFDAEGKVEISMLNNQGKADVYTGTYKVYSMMNTPQYIIQLDDIPGAENPMGGTTEGTTWDADKVTEAGGADIGFNTFYWISEGGRIVLSKMPDAENYGFNVAMGGGSNPDAGDHGDEKPPFAED